MDLELWVNRLKGLRAGEMLTLPPGVTITCLAKKEPDLDTQLGPYSGPRLTSEACDG